MESESVELSNQFTLLSDFSYEMCRNTLTGYDSITLFSSFSAHNMLKHLGCGMCHSNTKLKKGGKCVSSNEQFLSYTLVSHFNPPEKCENTEFLCNKLKILLPTFRLFADSHGRDMGSLIGYCYPTKFNAHAYVHPQLGSLMSYKTR